MNGDGEVDITEFDIMESDVTFFQEIDITESDVTEPDITKKRKLL